MTVPNRFRGHCMFYVFTLLYKSLRLKVRLHNNDVAKNYF